MQAQTDSPNSTPIRHRRTTVNHLLLDTAKLKTPTADIPFKHARVGILATFKQAKKLITPDEPHAIYVLPDKKAAAAITEAAAEILQHHPQSRIAIVSPRKKVAAAIAGLCARYPQADILYKKRLSKKARRFLKHRPDAPAAITVQTEAEPAAHPLPDSDEQHLIHTTAAHVQAAVAGIQAQSAITAEPSDGQPDNPPPVDAETEAALLLLKKNRPKKKSDLVRLLTQHPQLGHTPIDDLIYTLEHSGIIRIDVAENVKYQA